MDKPLSRGCVIHWIEIYPLSKSTFWKSNEKFQSGGKKKWQNTSLTSWQKHVRNYSNRYVEGEHKSHCPSPQLSAGLKKMPRPYVYSEQTGRWTSVPTTPRLPSGEELVGSESYKSLMRFFTTFNISTEELKRKAWERLHDLHNQVWLKLFVLNLSLCNDSAQAFAGIAH